MSLSLAKVTTVLGVLAGIIVMTISTTVDTRAAGPDRMANLEQHPWKASELIGQSVYTADDQKRGRSKT